MGLSVFDIQKYSSIKDFLSLVEPMLLEREAENSLMLGLCRSLVSEVKLPEKILLLVVIRNSLPYTVAVQTPPFNLILSKSDREAIDELTNFFSQNKIIIPGVVGPNTESTLFAEIYSSKMKCNYVLGMDQRIYEAKHIIVPEVKGSLKSASQKESNIVSQWLYEFGQESLPAREKFSFEFAQEWANKAIAEKTAYLWLDSIGNHVSVAHTGRPTQNGISIRAVFTPRDFRRLGYGSAVVANLSKKMLESFQFCSLYTDASNPTSNKIYEAIGYKMVAESNHYNFENLP